VPLNKIHDLLDDGKLNNSVSQTSQPSENGKSNGNQNATQHHFAMLGNQFGGYGKTKIKLKIFLRDFITWLIIMYIIYLLWKKFVHPLKMKKGLISPDVATHILPMAIGKKK
jgi:hypothetical protein